MRKVEIVASCRIGGQTLDPVELTQAIGISPSTSYRKGDARVGQGASGVHEQGFWCLDSSLPRDESLDSHVKHLLSKLSAAKEFLVEQKVKNGVKMDLFIGIFSEGSAGVTIPSETLRRVGEFGFDLGLDFYD